MDPNQVRLDQGDKLRRRRDRRSRGVENVKFEERRQNNQVGGYLQREQLPTNASTDQIFNASYQNQGLQPQNLNEPVNSNQEKEVPRPDITENRSRFSRRNEASNLNTNRAWNRRPRLPATNPRVAAIPKPQTVSTLTKRGLTRGRLAPVNSLIFLVGGKLWLLVQLPFAILCFISLGLYAVTNSEIMEYARDAVSSVATAISDIGGPVGSAGVGLVYFLDKAPDLSELAFPLLLFTTLVLHLLGLFTLLMLYITYRAALFKPLSGNHGILKGVVFLIAAIGYSTPLLNFAPWGLLVMGVVWLYPE